MSKSFQRGRLSVELLLATIASLTAAALLFLGLRTAAYHMLDDKLGNREFLYKQEAICAQRLQRYVTENHIQLDNLFPLDKWVEKERDVILFIYNGNSILYSSVEKFSLTIPQEAAPLADGQMSDTDLPADVTGDSMLWDVNELPANEWYSYHDIKFSDGTAQAVLSCFFEYRYYSVANAAAAILAFFLFVFLLLFAIRRKTRYIEQLERELKILEGGDLSYRITVRGRDELASLAGGIDAMRRAVCERQAEEERAQNANKQLITAMSHDLRTPLTALMGYLDILALRKYTGEEQLQQFLTAGREKAYQMKALTDKLFSYFLVYGKEEEEFELQQVSGEELLGQVVEESLFDLESEGFSVERETDEISCTLLVDVPLIQRVFGNLFSNITKYADKARPVYTAYRQRGGKLCITLQNSVDHAQGKQESTNIGLKTCETILQRHNGSFRAVQDGALFRVEMELPIL